ncbi:MAG: hypothetical protein MUP13_17750, partial [Thermoanaerobaculales bacterium]|nr:hypothetical protein [Thermoanaerobaculales bacterium]
MKGFAAITLYLAVVTAFGCQSISSPTTPNVRPDDFSACSDHHRRCRDRCAPAKVKEVACFADDMGGMTRICECEGDTVHEDIQLQPVPQ